MVTIFHTEKNILKDNKSYILTELRGLSTDEKPTTFKNSIIANGSVFIEIDTQNVFIYDLENEKWLPEDEEENQQESEESPESED